MRWSGSPTVWQSEARRVRAKMLTARLVGRHPLLVLTSPSISHLESHDTFHVAVQKTQLYFH